MTLNLSKSFLIINIFFFFLILPNKLLSDVYWEPVIGPEGAYIGILDIAPDGTFYAMGHGIYRSIDNLETWELIRNKIFPNFAKGLTIDSTGNLYTVASESNMGTLLYLFISSDKGNTWIKKEIGNDNFYDYKSFIYHKESCLYLLMTNYIKKISCDANNNMSIEKITPTYKFPLHRMVITKENDIFVASSDSIYHSSDNGLTWNSINKNFQSSSRIDIFVTDDGTLYVITDFGKVWKTKDKGNNFSQFNQNIDAKVINSFTFTKNNDIIAFCNNGIYKSTNDGENWELINDNFNYNVKIFQIKVNSLGDIVIGTQDGIFKSSDGGFTWFSKNNGLNFKSAWFLDEFKNSDEFIVYSYPGLFYIINNTTKSYQQLNTENIIGEVRRVYINSEKNIFITTYDGILYGSSDLGNSWKILIDSKGFPISYMSFAESGEIFLSGFVKNGLYKSSGFGQTFELSNKGAEDVKFFRPIYLKDNIMLVGTSKNGIYKSTNKGDSWFRVNFDTTTTIEYIVFNKNYDIYASSDTKLYKSTDMGDSWLQINSNLPSSQILVADDKTIYSFEVDYGKGVYISTNEGVTWNLLNSGIEHTSINDYTIGIDGRIYLATYNWLYRTSNPVNSVEFLQTISYNQGLSIFPNPLSNTGAIKYNLKEPGAVEIKLYDVLGNHLQTLFSGYKDASFGSIDFSVETIPIGVYYIVFKHNNNVIVEKFVKI